MSLNFRKMIMITATIVVCLLLALYFLGTNKITTKSELVIEKDIQAVWEVMGNQYADVHLWSSNFQDSQPGGAPKLDQVDYLYRKTITERGVTIQELDEFDPHNYSLKYHISEGAPALAKKAAGHWHLQKLSEGKTKVIIEFLMETQGVKAKILSPVIKKKVASGGQKIAEELKYYLENGQAHPNNSTK